MGRSLGSTIGLFQAGTLILCTAGLAGVGTVYFDKVLTEHALDRTRAVSHDAGVLVAAELRELSHKLETLVLAAETRLADDRRQARRDGRPVDALEISLDSKPLAEDPRILSVRYFRRAPGRTGEGRADWTWTRASTGTRLSFLDVRFPVEWESVGTSGRVRFAEAGTDQPVLRLAFPLKERGAVVVDVDPAKLPLGMDQDPAANPETPRYVLLDSAGRVAFQSRENRYARGEKLAAEILPAEGAAIEYRDVPDGPLFYGSRAAAGLGASILAGLPRRAIHDRISPFIAFAIAWVGLFGTMGILLMWRYVRENLTSRARSLEETVRGSLKSSYPVLIREQDGTDEIAGLARAFQEVLDRFRYRQRIHATLGKFAPGTRGSSLPPHLPENVWVNATYLHVSFGGLTDAVEAGRNATDVSLVLNDLLQTAQELLERSGGVLNQVSGAAFTAFWGVPSPLDDGTDRAIAFCLAIEEKLEWINKTRVKKGVSAVRLHAGLHHGPAFAGEIGPDHRLEFTLIGEAPELSGELHACARARGHRIIISAKALAESGRKNQVDPIADEKRWAGQAFVLRQSLPATAPIQLEAPPGAVDLDQNPETPAEIKAA